MIITLYVMFLIVYSKQPRISDIEHDPCGNLDLSLHITVGALNLLLFWTFLSFSTYSRHNNLIIQCIHLLVELVLSLRLILTYKDDKSCYFQNSKILYPFYS